MTVSAVTIPTPPNNNLDRAMFVWLGTAGSSQDSLSSATNMQNLLNWCSSKGANLLFLGMWGYLGSGIGRLLTLRRSSSSSTTPMQAVSASWLLPGVLIGSQSAVGDEQCCSSY